MKHPDQNAIDAVGEAVRVLLLSGENVQLPGVGELFVQHEPSQQVSDSRGTVVTAPSAVIRFRPFEHADDTVLLRAADVAGLSRESVAVAWTALLSSSTDTSLHLPGVGTFSTDDGGREFSANPALQHAVNARYTGYVDLAIVHDADRIEIADPTPGGDADLPNFERIIDEAEEAEANDVVEPWPDHALDEPDGGTPVPAVVPDELPEGMVADLPEELAEVPPEEPPVDNRGTPGQLVQDEVESWLLREAPVAAADADVEPPNVETKLGLHPESDLDSDLQHPAEATSISGSSAGEYTPEAAQPTVEQPTRRPDRTRAPSRRPTGWKVPAGIASLIGVFLVAAFLVNRFVLTTDESTPSSLAPGTEQEAPSASEAPRDDQLLASDDAEQSADEVPGTPSFTRGAINVAEGGFTLIVGSKTSESEAVILAATLAGSDRRVDILEAQVDGSTRYRVAVGQYRTFALASRALNQQADSLPEGSWIGRIE